MGLCYCGPHTQEARQQQASRKAAGESDTACGRPQAVPGPHLGASAVDRIEFLKQERHGLCSMLVKMTCHPLQRMIILVWVGVSRQVYALSVYP